MTTFPPELVEIIVNEAWHSEMPSYVRKRLMTTCPRINRTWKAVYAPIASRDMYITNFAFLDYLCRIARLQKSIIYHDFIPRLTRTITCFLSLEEYEMERGVEKVYLYLTGLPNLCGLAALFKYVRYISFRLYWILSRGPNSSCPILSLQRLCIRARHDRFLSHDRTPHRYEHRTGMPLVLRCFSLTDPDSCVENLMEAWEFVPLYALSAAGVPPHLYASMCFRRGHDGCVHKGNFHNHHTTYVCDNQLGCCDSKNINQRMWVASKGRHDWLSCLASFRDRWEFKRAQSSLPLMPVRFRGCVLEDVLKRQRLF